MVRRVFRSRIPGSLAIAMLLFAACPAFAADFGLAAKAGTGPGSGWQARTVGNEASPARLIAVDKRQQTLFLFERHSPLRLAATFSCTTGQAEGDKFVEGDLKTPEGVYFVVRRIDSGLDYAKYGYEAYTLNYPNPVDRLRRKSGSGIWIHGRGVPITPNLTEGCVSLNNADLTFLGKDLAPRTPVALAHAVNFSPDPTPEDWGILNTLYTKTHGWAKAWAGRSKKFFDYYDMEAYSIAQGESFSAFRKQKERIFKKVSFIDIKLANLQVLQGPGYWVTWFQQDYRASNLSSKGVRRLYWQKDNKGELRIVGMEWAPHLFGTLTAGLNNAPVSPVSSTAEAKAAKTTERPLAVAAAPQAKPASASPPSPPAASVPPPAMASVAPPAPVPAEPKPEVAIPVEEPVAVALVETAKPLTTAAKPDVPAAGPSLGESGGKAGPGDVAAFIESWRTAWEKGDLKAYTACYATDAVQGTRSGVSSIRSHKAGLWKKSRPKQVLLTNIRITSKQDIIVADMQQDYTDSRSFADMGIKTLHLRAKDGSWRIIREDWSLMQ